LKVIESYFGINHFRISKKHIRLKLLSHFMGAQKAVLVVLSLKLLGYLGA
jgi:hypothetical protein